MSSTKVSRQERLAKESMRNGLALGYCRDNAGEVSITLLAEWAIDTYGLDASDGAPVWDWAFEVGQEYEERQAK